MKPAILSPALLLLAAPARADLQDWLAEVAAGTAATYSDTNIAVPTQADIGTIALMGGATYEFIVNAANVGPSSAMMGARNTGFGNNAAIKFEQWNSTGQFGVTQAGVFDWLIVPNIENVDVHLAFVVDSNAGTTTLYIDGVAVGGAPFAPHLTDLVGVGEWYDPNGSVDPLVGALHGVATYDSMMPANEVLDHANAFHDAGGPIGTPYCGPASQNSTGQPGVITAFGSEDVAKNDVRLDAAQLALNQNSYFITSMTQGFVMPPGSQGFLCLGGTIGRFNANVLNTGGTGEVSLQIDLTNIPIGTGVAVQPGESWYFQLWYRDVNPMATSNFTDGVCITFQ